MNTETELSFEEEYRQCVANLLQYGGVSKKSKQGKREPIDPKIITDAFPRLSDYINVTPYDVMAKCGIPKEDAFIISLFGELMRRCIRCPDLKKPLSLKQKNHIFPYLERLFLCCGMPCIYLFPVNGEHRIAAEHKIHEGIILPSDMEVKAAMSCYNKDNNIGVVIAQYTAGTVYADGKQLNPFLHAFIEHEIPVLGVYRCCNDPEKRRKAWELTDWQNFREDGAES